MDEVLGHPFFKSVDREKLLQKQVEPPFRPQVKNSRDLTNFDPSFVSADVAESMLPEQSIMKIQEKKDCFEKFGFSTPDQ